MITLVFSDLTPITLIILTALAAFVEAMVFTWLLIPVLKKLKAGQLIREDGPQSHLRKAGTPTMGGVGIIAATLLGYLTINAFSAVFMIIALVFLSFGVLGFLDDFLKVKMKRNLGLTALQKFFLQIVIAAPAVIYQTIISDLGTATYVPIIREQWDLGRYYIPFAIFVMVAMVNSVNLTDGLDGLASGITCEVAVFFAVLGSLFTYSTNLLELERISQSALFCAALSGACAGFWVFNKKPAKIFMGDTGALALGGGISAAAMFMHMELMLPIVGVVFVAETVSVILQVGSYKIRRKRIFRMAPLHHHFELSGWSEERVVGVFQSVTLVFVLATFFVHIA